MQINKDYFLKYNKMLEEQFKDYQEYLLKRLSYESAKLELNMAYSKYFENKFGHSGTENIIKRRLEMCGLDEWFNRRQNESGKS